ncbi:MAG: type IV pilus secretin PilQ [Myxococcota bacterium]|nr:type IV pilus secretin PilQ [Myxococcota bacterium]
MLTKGINMRNAMMMSAALGGLLIISSPSLAEPNDATNVVSRIETEKNTAGAAVLIEAQQTPSYSVFRLTDPFRILIDINDAKLTDDFAAPAAWAHPSIQGLKATRISDENSSIIRVEITLDSKRQFEVTSENNRILASISIPQSNHTNEPTRIGKMTKKVTKSGVKIISKIQGDIPKPSDVSILELNNPPRVVIDIEGAKVLPKFQKLKVGHKAVKRARIGQRKDSVRLVVDLKASKQRPEVNVDAVDGNLVIAVLPVQKREEKRKDAPKAELAEAATSATTIPREEPQEAQEEEVFKPALVEDVRFEPKNGFVRLTVDLSKDATILKDSDSERNQPVLRLQNAELPKSLIRKLDTSAIAANVVNAISTYNDGKDIVLAAQINDGTEHRHWRKGNRIFWDFRTSNPQAKVERAPAIVKPASTKKQVAQAKVIPYAEQTTSSFSTDAAGMTGQIFTARKRYRGRRISLDLKDAEIHNVLRLLADVAKLNIVASDDVSGTVTLKLRNVPWDQALDIILQSKALDKTKNGNIIRVAPLATLVAEEKERLARKESKVLLDPLSIRLIPVNYADADGLSKQIAPLLTEQRGSVKVDKRTNVLVVEDIAEVLLKVERLVRTLDTQTPQILIEARIVEAATAFVRDLGIQWGGNSSLATQFGTQTGLQFPNSIAIKGGAEVGQSAVGGVLPQGNNFAINLPAPVGTGKGGALGFVFGSAGGSQLLALRLSAAEQQGKTKIISAPKIVTTDNTEARIISGEKVPITVVTANGPTTRFIDANLELTTTPHVTADGNVMLRISAKKNELSNRRDDIGTPGIITREASTQMLVRDGDTAVMGGIYRRTASNTEDYVPLLGRIPVLGWLFKKQARADSREELLIFISPRIINRDSAAVSGS